MSKIGNNRECAVCRERITINIWTYAPPVTNHPVLDEGLWSDDLHGYVGYECFGKVEWDAEDLQTLRHDWGWEPEDEEEN